MRKLREKIVSENEILAIYDIEKVLKNKLPILQDIIWNSYGISIEEGHITGLGLYNANILDIPEKILHFNYLKKLNLNNNDLGFFPEFICQLTELEELFFSGNKNKFLKLPENIGNLNKLRLLVLSRNEITSLPKSFSKLENLQILRLDNNLFKKIGNDFFSLRNLEYLYLANNKIQNLIIEENFENSNLRVLFLDNNNLNTLPENLLQLNNLEILSLSNNKLISLPSSLKFFTKLKTIKLDNNHTLKINSELESILNHLEYKGCKIKK